ncbi:Retrovirus-related Pol polyprotein from transposon RE2 [Vitis vinifera]|uniref:Retrovirus-related Pol polyprotein from transposon RE2 n=1 Tax=Vitis vinifera TaxID=29760 RepID=A0A438DXE7_VITVI|nr:Retrovirus-related Pol polyprotein from transposon RE2 [Vitis vinifera]
MFFVVLALCIFSLLDKTNFLLKPPNASSWDIPDFKRVIVIIPLRLIATFSPLMSLSLRTHRSFSTSESLPVSESYPFPLSPHLMQCLLAPLQLYHRRHRVAVHPSLATRYLLTHFLSLRLLLPPTLPSSADLPIVLRKVSCRWVYTIKVGLDGQVDRLKAHLVAKGYTQVYGSDYGDTFSPVAKIASVRLLLSMAAMRSWPLYQLDIKNAFLHENLLRKFIWSNHLVFVAQGESGLVCRLKDLGKLKYFLGIEIAQSSSDVVLSQRKYALDILEETGMLDCKPVDTPMDPNVKLIPGQGEPLADLGRYRRLVVTM